MNKNSLVSIMIGIGLFGCNTENTTLGENRLRIEHSLNLRNDTQCYIEHFIDSNYDNIFEEYVQFNYAGVCKPAYLGIPKKHIILEGKTSDYTFENSVVVRDVFKVPQKSTMEIYK